MHRSLAAAAVLTLALAATVTPTEATRTRDRLLVEPRPETGEAVVYLIAPDQVRLSGKRYPRDPVSFWVDDEFVGTLQKPSYTFVRVEPGARRLWSSDPRLQRDLELSAGETVYVRLWDLERLAPDAGRALLEATAWYELAGTREVQLAGRTREQAREAARARRSAMADDREGYVVPPAGPPLAAGACALRRLRLAPVRLGRPEIAFMGRAEVADAQRADERLAEAAAELGLSTTDDDDAPTLRVTMLWYREDVARPGASKAGLAPREDILRLVGVVRGAEGAVLWSGEADQPEDEPSHARIARRVRTLIERLAADCVRSGP